ncbi:MULTISPECIES: hypothetical protein [unclassified Serratia (in: enterobacteria)]|uniref:hypothetical protein n=1 Tax=unclassified Serratia (in: enterobacteria) TaxID=2647522 RepID=UPI00046A90D9|nr:MULTISPECIES: hypothetical protein [unclassified Serratia (in: enterobacteria)]
MDYPFQQVRTQEEYNRLLRGTPPPPPTPADKERDFQRILSEFKDVIKDYKTANGHWLYGSMLNMKQQFTIGDMQRESAPLENKPVNIAMSCGIEPTNITITHGFRSTRYIPIPQAKYTLVKRPVITQQRYNNYPLAGTAPPSRYGDTHKDNVVYSDKFDAQGKAVVTIPPCEAGYQYHLLVNTHITDEDRDALYAAYQETIDKYATWLTNTWNTQQRGAWQAYLQNGGLSLTETANAFLDGMVSQIKQLYDTIKQVWLWLSDVDKYAAKLAEFIGPEGIEKLKALPGKSAEALGDALTLLSDEILVFILIDALYCYFQLLTPQQIVNFVADAFGSLLVMVVLYLILPPGMGQMVLTGVDNISIMVPAS